MTGSGFPTIEEVNPVDLNEVVAAAVVDVVGGFCPCNLILTLTRTSSTSFRVTFSAPVENNPWLSQAGNWAVRDTNGVAPTLQVISSTPQAIANPTYVDLVTSEQRTGVNYEAEAFILETA